MNVALCSEHLDILSLCTGGGGLDLGVGLAIPCARTVCMVEREAFAVAQLVSAMQAGLLDEAAIWSDARTFDGRAWRGCVDGLIGGIPCQPHSLAGKKRGSFDHRDLWSDARRIIVQSRAWFVLIENVGGMLSAGDDEIAGAERVFRDLHKLSFEVEAGLFTAAEVGAPHSRERVFILAVADAHGRYSAGWAAERREKGRGWPHDKSSRSGYRLADSLGAGLEGRPGREVRDEQQTTERSGETLVDPSIARSGRIPVQPGRQDEAHSDAHRPSLFPPGPSALSSWAGVLSSAPELEPAFRRVADGLASRLDIARVDRLRLLGNGVVPLAAAYAIRTLATRLAGRGSRGAAKLMGMMVE